MKIIINGSTIQMPEPVSLSGLLAARGMKPGEAVVQYNGEIVEKSAWPEIMLKENDELEILRFVGGG